MSPSWRWMAASPAALASGVAKSSRYSWKGGEGVGVAVVLDVAGLGQVHEIHAGAAEAVAGGAERGDVAELGDVAGHLVESAVIAQGELGPSSCWSASYPPGFVRLPAEIWDTPRANVSWRILAVSRVDMMMPV